MGSFSPAFEGWGGSGDSIYQKMEGLGHAAYRWSTASLRLLWIKWLTIYSAHQLPGAGDVASRGSLARKYGTLVSWSYEIISPTTAMRGVLVGELTIGPVRVSPGLQLAPCASSCQSTPTEKGKQRRVLEGRVCH